MHPRAKLQSIQRVKKLKKRNLVQKLPVNLKTFQLSLARGHGHFNNDSGIINTNNSRHNKNKLTQIYRILIVTRELNMTLTGNLSIVHRLCTNLKASNSVAIPKTPANFSKLYQSRNAK